MRRCLSVIIFLLMVLSISACEKNNLSRSDFEGSGTLARALTGADNIQIIERLSILYKCNPEATAITDNKDWTFLEEYTYSHVYPNEELQELFTFPSKISIIEVEINGFNEQLYLMNDGSILKRTMCGDSEVKDISYDVYKTEEKNYLNEEKLKKLIEKY